MNWGPVGRFMDEAAGYKVADISLADEGELRVDWARSRMPVLATLRATTEGEDSLLYTSPSPRDERGSRMPSSSGKK